MYYLAIIGLFYMGVGVLIHLYDLWVYLYFCNLRDNADGNHPEIMLEYFNTLETLGVTKEEFEYTLDVRRETQSSLFLEHLFFWPEIVINMFKRS